MATRTWIKPDGPDRGFKILEFDDLDNESMLVHAQKQGYVEFQRPLTLEDPEGWFSGAYEYFPEEKKVKINLDKAKAGYLAFLRKARARKFEELDKKHLRALVSKDENKIQEIEEFKQALRDMPEKLPLHKITNIFELVHLFPPILLPDE